MCPVRNFLKSEVTSQVNDEYSYKGHWLVLQIYYKYCYTLLTLPNDFLTILTVSLNHKTRDMTNRAATTLFIRMHHLFTTPFIRKTKLLSLFQIKKKMDLFG